MNWKSSSVVQNLPQRTQILTHDENGMLECFKKDPDAKRLVKLLNSITRRTMSQVIGNSIHAKQQFKFSDLLNPTDERNPHIALIKGTTKGLLEKPKVMEPLAMYLTLCKVLDWLYATQEGSKPVPPALIQERFTRTNEFYFERCWEYMESLSKLLVSVTACMGRAVDIEWEDDVAAGCGKQAAVSSTIAAGILKCKAVKDVQNQLLNILTAALQLNVFEKTALTSESTVVPLSKGIQVDDLFLKYGNPANKDKLYGPLSAAVLIDPIFLFVPFVIAENSPCLQEYIIACKALGSERPPLIEAVNVRLFTVIRRVANGSIKPRELPGELLDILESEELQAIYDSKALDEWYKAKGPIVRFNGHKKNKAPLLWEGYVKGQTKRKRTTDEDELPATKKPKGKSSQAGHSGSSLASAPPPAPSDAQDAVVPPPADASKQTGASQAAPATPPPSPKRITDAEKSSSPSPVPRQNIAKVILPHRSMRKLKRMRPLQNYAIFDETRRHSRFAGDALSVEDREAVAKECKPLFSNAESRVFWNARRKDIVANEQDTSMFSRVDHASFMASQSSKRESYLSRCLLLKDMPEPETPVTLEDAIATCGPMDTPRVVHDLCLPVGDSYNNKQRLITFNELLKVAHDLNDHRALNILDIPDLSHHSPMTFDLVRVAWLMTCLLPFFQKTPFPQGHFTWKLAATSGAMHGLHIDAEGLGTEINVLAGEKVWGVIYDARQPLPSTLIQEARPFKTFGANLPEGYVAKAVRLTPNTRFFLPPGVIHFVTTTETSVCTGGHLYAWGIMRQTLWSLIHVRIRDQSTNTEHGVWSESLVRIMAFFHHEYILGHSPQHSHLPSLQNGEDWENLCSLFVIMELLNVLSAETFKCSLGLQHKLDRLKADRKGKSTARTSTQAKKALDNELNTERKHDVNRLSDYQRMLFVTGRGLAQHSIDCLVDESTGRTFRNDLFVPMMASTIFHFRQAFELSVANDVDPFWESQEVRQLFFEQLDSVLQRHADVKDAYDALNGEKFDWETADMNIKYDVSANGYQVQASIRAEFDENTPFALGVSSRDVVWLENADVVVSDEDEDVIEEDAQSFEEEEE